MNHKAMNMKNRYTVGRRIILSLFAASCIAPWVNAQHSACGSTCENFGRETVKVRKAWEFGVGANALQMTRFNVLDFRTNPQGGYFIDTSKRDFLFGGHLYLARELNSHFYLDLQGAWDYSADPVRSGRESRWAGMAGLGLQWRLGEYFHSPFIDPFLRAGVNYMYKNFEVDYNGLEAFERDRMGWSMSNDYNKEGHDRQHLIPLSLGAGVNMWLNDRLGIGLQADYLFMPYRNVANSWNGTVRLMWRLGGKAKRCKEPEIRYVEKVVERIVEKPVVVEKRVEVPASNTLCELFNNVYFDFDKWEITAKSSEVLDHIARIMLDDIDRKYLITGCTDAKGSTEYNLQLSRRRADAVVKALIDRGVPAGNLKSRGVGKKISYASRESSDAIRESDRKIMVEVITNMEYWNHIR